jgi:hypothetical protein
MTFPPNFILTKWEEGHAWVYLHTAGKGECSPCTPLISGGMPVIVDGRVAWRECC